MPKCRSWLGQSKVVLSAIARPVLVLLIILSIPFALPFVAIAEARTARRKAALVLTWPCGWCVAPLGQEALARADALFGAYVEGFFAEFRMMQPRIVRNLHACCPRCDAGHRYEAASDRFVLLHPAEFRDVFGAALRDAVPPATAAMAWPWLALPGPMHQVVLTRDSVCPADEARAPHTGMVEVPAATDVAAIAEALLRSGWLAQVGSDATWWCSTGPVILVFGLRAARPFVQRMGEAAVDAATVAGLHVHDAAGRDPGDLCGALAGSGGGASP